MYGAKDEARGDAATFLWLTEEFGELATAVRAGNQDELAAEMADVLAWLATLANIRGIDLEAAVLPQVRPGLPRLLPVPVRVRPGGEALDGRSAFEEAAAAADPTTRNSLAPLNHIVV